MIGTLNDATGIDIAPEYLPARPGDILHSLADVSLAREYLSFEALVSFREGIDLIVKEGIAASVSIAA